MKTHTAFKWKDAISGFPVSPGSAEAQVRCGEKIKYTLIAYFLGNIYAKNCRNRTVYVKIIASCKGGTFFETQCILSDDRNAMLIWIYTARYIVIKTLKRIATEDDSLLCLHDWVTYTEECILILCLRIYVEQKVTPQWFRLVLVTVVTSYCANSYGDFKLYFSIVIYLLLLGLYFSILLPFLVY